MSSQPQRPSARARSMPILSLISACIVAIAGPIALGYFAEVAAGYDAEFNALTLFILDHRWWMIAVALPAILLSVFALLSSNFAARIGLALVSSLSLAAVLVIIVYAAINVFGPLYTYQDL